MSRPQTLYHVIVLVVVVMEEVVKGFVWHASTVAPEEVYLIPSHDITGQKYDRIFIICKLNQPSKYDIRWYHNERLIERPPPFVLTSDGGSVLMVRPLLPDKTDGFYECAAVAGGKVYFRRGIRVTVKDASQLPEGFPKILHHPQDVLNPREDITFYCSVEASNSITVLWLFNRRPFDESQKDVLVYSTVNSSVHTSTLVIKNHQAQHKGWYECVVINSVGQLVSKQSGLRMKGIQLRDRRGLVVDSELEYVSTTAPALEASTSAVNVEPTSTSSPSPPLRSTMPAARSTAQTSSGQVVTPGIDLITLGPDDTIPPLLVNSTLIPTFPGSAASCPSSLQIVDESQWPGYVGEKKLMISCYNDSMLTPAGILVSWHFPSNIGKSLSFPIESYQVHYAFRSSELYSKGRCKQVSGNSTFHTFLTKSDGYVWDLPIFILVIAQPSPVFILKMAQYSSCADGAELIDKRIVTVAATAAPRTSSAPLYEKLLPILMGIAVAIVALLIVIIVVRRRHKPAKPSPAPGTKCLVYISYYPDTPPFVDCVLNFAGRLRSEYGVQVEIDAWSRREIDSCGIAQWCERMHASAKKIVILFSPKYIEVYDAWLLGQADPLLTDENKLRVCADIEYIKSDIYRRGQRSDRCIYVTAGAKSERVVELIKGRPLYKFPQSEDDYRTLCFALEGKEQVSAPECVGSELNV